MRKKHDVDFQIFIFSRFLVSLIFVVMAEYLVLMLITYLQRMGLDHYPLILLLVTVVLFVAPILVTINMFTKVIVEEVQRLEEEKSAYQREYEKKRNLMLSDIAHDLRTPITTIAGYSKALNDGMVTDDEKRREYLEAIENKSERMNNLINLLYEYVKLDSDNFALKKEEIDLAELLRENAALLYSDVEEKGMELVVDIPEEPCMVTADSLQLSRVITNLINNSIRHNEPGTEITLELNDVFYNREIIISDNGEPIEEDIVEHIFEPFAVGDKSRRTKGGSGLGLSIAKRIIDMHGWKIDLYQNKRGYKKAFIINIK
ncbi:MAG: HAMP domain-containing histidine kinase [Agathobacter sp.]|nr:HAMP domain-containing histidine kinase [Agathobacter sp.]